MGVPPREGLRRRHRARARLRAGGTGHKDRQCRPRPPARRVPGARAVRGCFRRPWPHSHLDRVGSCRTGRWRCCEPLVRHSGLDPHLDGVLSVDAAGIFKPSPRVYQLAVDKLRVPASRIGFVSSNCWDAIGAKAFGLAERSGSIALGAPVDRHGPAPDRIIATPGRPAVRCWLALAPPRVRRRRPRAPLASAHGMYWPPLTSITWPMM